MPCRHFDAYHSITTLPDRCLFGSLSEAKLRHILAALEQLPDRLAQFRKELAPRAHTTLPTLEQAVVRAWLPARHTIWCLAEIAKSVKHTHGNGQL